MIVHFGGKVDRKVPLFLSRQGSLFFFAYIVQYFVSYYVLYVETGGGPSAIPDSRVGSYLP